MADEAAPVTRPATTPASPVPPDRSMEEGVRLIHTAFETARTSGRGEWWRMTVAVLKNRILDETGRDFDEQRWGVPTFADFVRLFPDVVSIDDSTRPATVELLGNHAREEGGGEAIQPRPGDRIRPDLWRAVLDWSNDTRYVWRDGRAVAVAAESEDAPGQRLPTAGPETLKEWRTAFVEAASPLPDPLATTLAHWRDERLPDSALPRLWRGRWTGELKRRVLEELDAWFETSGAAPPPDIVQRQERPSHAGATSTESLRRLVVQVVQGMTREELEELRLPAAALLRTGQ